MTWKIAYEGGRFRGLDAHERVFLDTLPKGAAMDANVECRLVERVDSLERASRWWRRGAVIVIVTAAVICFAGRFGPNAGAVQNQSANAAPAEVITKRLAVRDEDGKDRIILVVNNNGVPVMGFLDKNGREQLDIFYDPSGTPCITMKDGNLTPRMVLKVNANGIPEIDVCDKDAKNRAILQVRADSSPVLGMVDADGKERIDLLIHPNGDSMLHFTDSGVNDRVVLSSAADGTPLIQLLDKSGKALFKAPAP
jgi:hypothetical protein